MTSTNVRDQPDSSQGRTSGRPRNPAVDHAIARAVCQVLQERGYTALSFELVAASAGVSRPTLYRRASSKAALVVAALVDQYGLDPVADTGDIEADLTALQQQQIRLYNDAAFQAALPGVLSDIRTDEKARAAWVTGFVTPRREGVERAVRQGIDRGQLGPETDSQWACEILTGPLVSSAFLLGPHPLPDTLVTETVTLVIRRFGT